jgi:hypothetical protein
VIENGEHLFITQSENRAVSKSPKGMFQDLKIPNDLKFVDTSIRNYYGLENINYPNEEEKTNG